jgi:hypothetical protein
MKYKNYISSEIIAGQPYMIEETIKRDIIGQLQVLKGDNYENICFNMRLTADVIEILEEYINDEFIVLTYNPMGAWYKEEDLEEIEYYKEVCSKEE